MSKASAEWDGAAVRTWLEGRTAAARADQVAGERAREDQEDYDPAAAAKMVCAPLRRYGEVFSWQEVMFHMQAPCGNRLDCITREEGSVADQ